MARKTLTFDAVRTIGLRLPGVDAGTAYGSDALKANGKMIACVATNKSAEPGSLVVCLGFAQRDELIAAEPETYYLKDHYLNYPVVLVRLARIHEDALRDLLLMAVRFVSARGKKGSGLRAQGSGRKQEGRTSARSRPGPKP